MEHWITGISLQFFLDLFPRWRVPGGTVDPWDDLLPTETDPWPIGETAPNGHSWGDFRVPEVISI